MLADVIVTLTTLDGFFSLVLNQWQVCRIYARKLGLTSLILNSHDLEEADENCVNQSVVLT
jgi:hypothetical protein